MNKTKKIVAAVVSMVMAGSLVIPLAACTPKNSGNKGGSLEVKVDENGNLTYAEGTEIKTSMGYNSDTTGITYTRGLIGDIAGSSATSMVIAGVRYAADDVKPAWQSVSNTLGIKITDDWVSMGNIEAGKNISEIKTKNGLASYGLITASATTIVNESTSNAWLDVNAFLDYMPNYKAFLEANPVVRLSLTADTKSGAMYMLPYFDGNDDIEKYVLMRKDIVEKLLDTENVSAATGTFASQAAAKNKASNNGIITVNGTKSSVESFMGKTSSDNYKIDVTDPAALIGDKNNLAWGNDLYQIDESKKMNTVELTVDYGAVITALGDSNSALYSAVSAALPSGTAVQKTSGNIIDIQNQIINTTNGTCTGAQLINVLKEYIKVAYHKTGESTSFYTKLSDVFNSAYAAWDVDLYVALGRAAMCSSALLGNSSKGENAYFLGSRLGTTNRTYDIASMAGELYGVRGLTSRYASLYAYIDNEGNIVDGRSETVFWDALDKMSALAAEGLYYTGKAQSEGVSSIANNDSNGGIQFYSSTDYVQTQTRAGGFYADGSMSGSVEAGYNYAPILTPVSRWDVDGDGNAETVMRFTESWRGVKDGGLAIPLGYVQGNPDRLSAVLKLVDYMYSNDGQKVLTYGPFSSEGNVTRDEGNQVKTGLGTWYGTPVTAAELGVSGDVNDMAAMKAAGVVDTYDGEMYYVTSEYEGLCFAFGNKLYKGTYYNGKMVPTMTDESKSLFFSAGKGNFTNYARYYLGSALNFGNKDQGFEYQCTAQCGLVGADIWAIANVNGTIKHTVPTIDSNNWWYTLVPTVLPFTNAQITAMSDTYKTVSGYGSAANTNFFYANKSADGNILTDVMYKGYAGAGNPLTGMTDYKLAGDANGMILVLEGEKQMLTRVDGFLSIAWNNIKTYYNTLVSD